MKFWNVVAGMSITLVLVYVSFCGISLTTGGSTFAEFKEAISPIVTLVLGYMAAMLPKGVTE